MPHTVTLVSGVRLRPGTEEAHGALHRAGVMAARSQGGLVRDELIPAVAGVQDETVALLTFSDRDALDRWLRSAERAEVLSQMADLSAADRTLNVLAGFPGWFTAPGVASPARWKQALIVIVGLVPVSFLVTEARQAAIPDLPLVGVVVINAVANVCVLTWLVMPPLNRLFSRWLMRGRS